MKPINDKQKKDSLLSRLGRWLIRFINIFNPFRLFPTRRAARPQAQGQVVDDGAASPRPANDLAEAQDQQNSVHSGAKTQAQKEVAAVLTDDGFSTDSTDFDSDLDGEGDDLDDDDISRPPSSP